MKKLFVLFTLAALIGLSGCNTWRGLGKDIEQVGEKMQKKPSQQQ